MKLKMLFTCQQPKDNGSLSLVLTCSLPMNDKKQQKNKGESFDKDIKALEITAFNAWSNNY